MPSTQTTQPIFLISVSTSSPLSLSPHLSCPSACPTLPTLQGSLTCCPQHWPHTAFPSGPGLPLSTRTLSRPGVHDPELHLGAARSPGPALPREALLGDAPSCPRPDPPVPLGPRGVWGPRKVGLRCLDTGRRPRLDGWRGEAAREESHSRRGRAWECSPGLLVSHQHLKIVHVVTYVTD